MKADKLMDAITELDDEILNEAAGEPSADARRRAKSGRKTLLFKFAAAAAALAVTVGGIFMITRKPAQNTPGTDSTKLVSADTGKKAEALVQPVYPEEWTREQELSSNTGLLERPYVARVATGREAADLYRGFFADMMLLLLSDQEQESAVMSPVNIFMATAMLAEITDGAARQEILDALGAADIEQLRDQAAKVWGLCYKDDGYEKTVLGNSLWLNNTLSYRTDTLKPLADSYYASAFRGEMGSEKYNSLLQKWINDMTGGLLADQVKNIEMGPGTALALISTVWHETKWGNEFDPQETKPGTFHAPEGDITVDMMHSDWTGNEYFFADRYKFIKKDTFQGNVWLFLPDEGTSVQEMMQEESFRQFLSYRFDERDYFAPNSDGVFLKGNTTRGITGAFARVNLTVPKLDISCQQDLTAVLVKKGIHTAFTAGEADYSPITDEPGVYLQEAKQGTRLVMDEEGVSAASYVEMLAGSAMLEDEIDLIFDRPFFILITGANEIPLFAGVVNVP
ncbi:MAG: hypothetical protein IJK77_01450 [Lachnospiraceae bacterium]|nr:hypothetical protein [Lachnospiraceae bacterium]